MEKLKGSLLFGQSGGPTSVINASAYGVFSEAFNHDCITRVLGAHYGIKGILDDDLFDINSESREELELLKTMPSSALGSVRYKLKPFEEDETDYKRVLEIFRKYNVRYFLYNGGNDSMDTVCKIGAYLKAHGYKCNVVGVPKTIDNDLMYTDHTPGYGSAAKYIATILKEVICDSSVYNIRSVTVAEIMGRHTGWLAGAASLAAGADCNGPDIILLPERPFDENVFLEKVAQLEKDRHNVIIAASEGVKNKDGVFLCDLVSTAGQLDAFGHKAILSGTSRYLADLIHVRLGCKTRAIEFSTLQRCASHLASRTDITEAYQVGGASVEAAYRGETGKMCAIRRISDMPYRTETEMVDVQKVANLEKRVPDDWISPDGMHVTEAFHRYARPLIQAELTPIYIDGVPRHLHLH